MVHYFVLHFVKLQKDFIKSRISSCSNWITIRWRFSRNLETNFFAARRGNFRKRIYGRQWTTQIDILANYKQLFLLNPIMAKLPPPSTYSNFASILDVLDLIAYFLKTISLHFVLSQLFRSIVRSGKSFIIWSDHFFLCDLPFFFFKIINFIHKNIGPFPKNNRKSYGVACKLDFTRYVFMYVRMSECWDDVTMTSLWHHEDTVYKDTIHMYICVCVCVCVSFSMREWYCAETRCFLCALFSFFHQWICMYVVYWPICKNLNILQSSKRKEGYCVLIIQKYYFCFVFTVIFIIFILLLYTKVIFSTDFLLILYTKVLISTDFLLCISFILYTTILWNKNASLREGAQSYTYE